MLSLSLSGRVKEDVSGGCPGGFIRRASAGYCSLSGAGGGINLLGVERGCLGVSRLGVGLVGQ